MIRKLAIALLLFVALPSWGAVALVGTPASASASNTGPAAVSTTVPSGSNTVAYILFWIGNGNTIGTVSTFAGQTPTLVNTYADNSLFLYRVLNPTPGSTSASATKSGDGLWSASVIYFSGVDQTTPNGTPTNDTNTEVATLTTTFPSAVGGMGLGALLMVGNPISAADGSTLAASQQGIDGSLISTTFIYETGAASVTLGGTVPESFADNFIIGLPINASGGGGGSTVPAKFYHYINGKKK